MKFEQDAPLWAAIKKLDAAKRRKANKKLIAMLQKRFQEEVEKTRKHLGLSSDESIIDFVNKNFLETK